MPNRVLRDGLIYSGAINSVGTEAECLYVRIVLAADDFGLIEIEPMFLKTRCLPGREIGLSKISALTQELIASRLLREYSVTGKQYAAVEKWDQRRFAKKSKYPMPPWGTEHIRGGYVDPRAATPKPVETQRVPTVGKKRTGFELPAGFEEFWNTYPKKIAKPAALRAWKALKLENGQCERLMASLREQAATFDWIKEAGRYIPHPASWLNQRRWEDETSARPPAASTVPSQFR